MDPTNPLSNLFSACIGFATGNPIAAAAGVAGLGMSIFGGISKMDAAQKSAAASAGIAQAEQQQEVIRQRMMEVGARRQQMEVLRNQQRARSLALNNATTQGAQQGSGLQGGYGQIAGQSGVNALGISQNLEAGEQMFGLSAQISGQKVALAQAGGQAATAQGVSGIGSTLLGAVGPIKNLTTNRNANGGG